MFQSFQTLKINTRQEDHEGHEGFDFVIKNFVSFVLFVVKTLLPFGCGFAALSQFYLKKCRSAIFKNSWEKLSISTARTLMLWAK